MLISKIREIEYNFFQIFLTFTFEAMTQVRKQGPFCFYLGEIGLNCRVRLKYLAVNAVAFLFSLYSNLINKKNVHHNFLMNRLDTESDLCMLHDTAIAPRKSHPKKILNNHFTKISQFFFALMQKKHVFFAFFAFFASNRKDKWMGNQQSEIGRKAKRKT